MLKRILTLGFIGAVLVMLAACYGKDEKKKPENAGQQTEQSTEQKPTENPQENNSKKASE